MIISHKHKFIFVAIPKTGTHSVREALRPILGQYDWEQCNLIVNKSFPHQEIANIGHGHFTLSSLNKYLPENMLVDYYSFCFVRNPYERFLSYCYFINRKNNKMVEKPHDAILEILNNKDLFENKILLKPQHIYTHENELQIIDFIGRIENMNSDFKHILSSCNLTNTEVQLGLTNVTKYIEKIQLTEEMKSLVHSYYQEDFIKFNYEI